MTIAIDFTEKRQKIMDKKYKYEPWQNPYGSDELLTILSARFPEKQIFLQIIEKAQLLGDIAHAAFHFLDDSEYIEDHEYVRLKGFMTDYTKLNTTLSAFEESEDIHEALQELDALIGKYLRGPEEGRTL
jgi:hypothetical protein